MNAIKYNKTGGTVALECSVVAPDSIRISIADTGVGLTREQLGQLFQPFNRLGIEFARTFQPDVILMDINLPGMNGFEAMKILRAAP